MAHKKNLIGDPNVFIALAAQNGAVAQREAQAWSVVANLARAVSLRDSGDAALSREFEKHARDELHVLMTNALYAGVLPLAETSPHVQQIILQLVEAL
jgi:predicted glycosyl hydrolase (DUF1957 family)